MSDIAAEAVLAADEPARPDPRDAWPLVMRWCDRPCRACGHVAWARWPGGELLCTVCHPPACPVMDGIIRQPWEAGDAGPLPHPERAAGPTPARPFCRRRGWGISRDTGRLCSACGWCPPTRETTRETREEEPCGT